MSRLGRSWPVLVLGTLAIAIGMRALVLAWSPLPATLDGFRYARLARVVLETGSLLTSGVQSDELVTTLVLATGSALTGVRPLYLAQPLVAVLGGASVVSAVVLVRETARARSWSPARTKLAATVAALGLAASGLYLRRTGVPDEEALGLLLLPLFALAAHRVLETRRPAWVVSFGVLALAYPPLHNLSSVVAAFTLTALVASTVGRAAGRSAARAGVGMLALFWGYFFGYYALAERLGLELTYSGLFLDHPGVLVAWLIALVVGLGWLRTTSGRKAAVVPLVGVGALFVVAGLNAVVPVFPGTVTTPTVVLGLVALYLVPAGLSVAGLSRLRDAGRGGVREASLGGGHDADRGGAVLTALFFGPLALTWFMLTTELTPAFFAAVLRVQVHLHVAVFVLAAVGAVELGRRRPAVGRALVGCLVVATVLTAPLAFVHLDTATAPRTVHASEFAAVSFASTGGSYAADQRLARVGPLYYGEAVTGSVAPTRRWLRGGEPPPCLTVAQRSWTRGAHFYPLPPERISGDRLEEWRTRHHLVYSVDGTTRTDVVVPTDATRGCEGDPFGTNS